jgi:hypothetical protein
MGGEEASLIHHLLLVNRQLHLVGLSTSRTQLTHGLKGAWFQPLNQSSEKLVSTQFIKPLLNDAACTAVAPLYIPVVGQSGGERDPASGEKGPVLLSLKPKLNGEGACKSNPADTNARNRPVSQPLNHQVTRNWTLSLEKAPGSVLYNP